MYVCMCTCMIHVTEVVRQHNSDLDVCPTLILLVHKCRRASTGAGSPARRLTHATSKYIIWRKYRVSLIFIHKWACVEIFYFTHAFALETSPSSSSKDLHIKKPRVISEHNPRQMSHNVIFIAPCNQSICQQASFQWWGCFFSMKRRVPARESKYVYVKIHLSFFEHAHISSRAWDLSVSSCVWDFVRVDYWSLFSLPRARLG
jgi:hypothetical protein